MVLSEFNRVHEFLDLYSTIRVRNTAIILTGKVVHFEIPADNVERAEAFYKNAFGWQMNSVPGMSYTLVGTIPTDDRGMPTEPGAPSMAAC